MDNLTKIRLCVMLKNYTYSKLRLTRNCHFLLKNEVCYLKKQQQFLQSSESRGIFYAPIRSPSVCLPNILNNVKQFSVTYKLDKDKDRGKDKKKQKLQRVDLNEMNEVIDVEKLNAKFEKAIDDLKDDFIKYLSVRSNIGAIEELCVKFDGKDYTLQELTQISRKPKLLVLNASTFPQAIPAILKSLAKNQMKLNPQQDGTTIYIPIPKVTREHRETLAKNAKSFYVKCCNNVRDIRNKQIKTVKDKKGLAKDLIFRLEGYIDTFSQQYMSKAEQLLESKQKELLGDSE